LTGKTTVYVGLIAVIIGLIGGFTLGWRVYDHPQASSGGYSGPAAHKDGSVTLERKPDSLTAPVTALPDGDRAVRVIKLRVRDTVRVVIHVRDTEVVCPPCDEIPLDLTISTGKDGDHVTAKGPAGVLITGTDIPITAGAPSKPRPWRAGVALDPFGRRGGAVALRDIGPFFLGAAGIYGVSGGVGVVFAGVKF